MVSSSPLARALCALLALSTLAAADDTILLADRPSISPDGATIAFQWRGDIWTASAGGGVAKRLTTHPAIEETAHFSRDGKRVAFVSQRTGSRQVFEIALDGGSLKQRTIHSEGAWVQDWFPGSDDLLILSPRDHYWYRALRPFRRPTDMNQAAELLFDAQLRYARVSPDGKKIAIIREGVATWRKGYRGSRASQIWIHDLEAKTFTRLSKGPHEERWPMWAPDGKSLFFVSEEDGTANLWSMNLTGGDRKQLTGFEDDGVVYPRIAADAGVIVFRRLFHLFLFDPRTGSELPIELRHGGAPFQTVLRENLKKATQVAFAKDGREIAFAAGGDIWVMDAELKEPVRVTNTPEEERDPVFSPDFETLVFVSDEGGQPDLYAVKRADEKRYWWQNETFVKTRLTEDPEPESAPRYTADGETIVFTKLRGDIWRMRADGSAPKRVIESWNRPTYDLSPDGKWIAYSIDDSDFNSDVRLRRLDGTGEARNLTLHPDYDGSPAWSPDGKVLAFIGRRTSSEETDLYFVFLQKGDHDADARDRKIEKAIEAMKKRKTDKKKDKKEASKKDGEKPEAKPDPDPDKPENGDAKKDADVNEPAKDESEKKKKPKETKIDFEGIEDRVRRVKVPGTGVDELYWSPDSKKLAFRAKRGEEEALYTVEIPDGLEPKQVSKTVGAEGRWIKEGDRIVWLVKGQPAATAMKDGKTKTFGFRTPVETDLAKRHEAAFHQCWRRMRDRYYDERMNNRDWNAVRAKYAPAARNCVTFGELQMVVSMMLGELNGSHLGFWGGEPNAWKAPPWTAVSYHFGLRFDPKTPKPGLVVTGVMRNSPASFEKSRIREGERLMAIDGVPVDRDTNLAAVASGPLQRDVTLRVRGIDGKGRDVKIRPVNYKKVRGELHETWVRRTRATVDKLSGGRLGYLHVPRMHGSTFDVFEAELYRVGHGKDGLVIDVRENGGGYTADHLLTCLMQPVHASTVPRGGEGGYPQGRMVYARWHKPIVVLCNQNSFSNAEIFSHAIKTLGRGRLVGVPTAGGVISTGAAKIMGIGTLRIPMRGWFLRDTGQDMELNGCVPDVILWPEPGEMPAGIDRQLEKAVELLKEDVLKFQANPGKAFHYRAAK